MRTGQGWVLAGIAAALAVTACSSDGTAAPAASAGPPPTRPATTAATSSSPKQPALGPSGSDTGPVTGPDTGADAIPAGTGVAAAPGADRCAETPPRDPRTLTVWHRLGGDVAPAYLAAQLDEFAAEHPGVTVDLVYPAGTADQVISELARLPLSERPDVLLVPPGLARMAHDSLEFLAPAECAAGERPASLADLLPAVEATFTVAGELWAAPYNVSVPMLMYDRVRWIHAGLDPDDPPATFDELFATAEALVASGEVTTGLALYDRSASWLVTQTAARDGRLLFEPDNGRNGVQIESVEFEQPGVVELLERLHQLKAEGKLAWLRDNPGGTGDLLALVRSDTRSGMTFHTSASLGDIYALLEAAGWDAEVGAAPLPGGSGTGASLGGGGWWLVDREDPAQAAAAWELVDWLVQPERVGGLAAATGYVPTSAAAAESPVWVAQADTHPELRTAYEIAVASPTGDAAFFQVGPEVNVQRYLELAVAFPIDAGSDPTTELQKNEALAFDILRWYATGQPDG